MSSTPEYPLNWITSHLATGFAPMSYAQLESIKKQGVDAIVNLCAEFSDLHEIEESMGFEVIYLPTWDEDVPDMEAMEGALAWLDEALYLGKKILVHCRYGIGRTGTFVTAYMIRKGMKLKQAKKKLKPTSANPSSYSQWKMIKKYGKKTGALKIREPSLETRHSVDLSRWFGDYEALVRKVESNVEGAGKPSGCGRNSHECCYGYFTLTLMEVIYLTSRMNRHMTSDTRIQVIDRAVDAAKQIRNLTESLGGDKESGSMPDAETLVRGYDGLHLLCPLNDGSGCLLYDARPVRCRAHGLDLGPGVEEEHSAVLRELSRNVFFSFSGMFLESDDFLFSLADAVSGRFVQQYFQLLIKGMNL